MRRLLPALAGLAVTAVAACSGNGLRPSLQNVVDTVSVGSLIGTPLSVPSGYSLNARRAVRTDSTANFDFAYTILPDGRRVFLPLGALGLGTGGQLLPGFITRTDAFDAINEAPPNGYRTRDTLALAVGDRFIVRSSLVCTQFGVPKYAKLEVIGFDDPNRLVRFQILVNQNCGFRSLRLGLPEN